MAVHTCVRNSFPSNVRNKGEAYVRDKRVAITARGPGIVESSVQGSAADPYVVFLRMEGKALAAACECPHFADGFLCKHLWAAIVESDRQRKLDLSRTSQGLIPDDFDDMADGWLGEVFEVIRDSPSMSNPSGTVKGAAPVSPPPARRESPPAWKSRLSSVLRPAADAISPHARVEAQVEYVINVGRSLTAKGLVIEVVYRSRNYSGQLVTAPLPLNRDGVEDRLSDVDLRFLELFRAADGDLRPGAMHDFARFSYGYMHERSSVTLPTAYSGVLKELCDTNRCRWILNLGAPILDAPVLRWDAGPPYRLRLAGEIASAKKKQWTIRAELVRGDEPPIPLSEVVHASGSAVLFTDRLAAADLEAQRDWVAAFRKQDKLTVPFADRDAFVADLWSSNSRPELALPPELMLEQAVVAPRPRLVLNPHGSASQKFPAAVFFDYGGVEFSASDPRLSRVDLESGKTFPRDIPAERAVMGDLWARGFEPARRNKEDDPHLTMPRKELPHHVSSLTDAGWTVVSDGRAIRKPGEFRISVTSGVDWFDLDATFDFGGVSAKLPALLQALRDGKKYVVLDDGTQGMLPEDWLQKYGGLSNLGESQDDVVRFKSSQAMLLDALLASQDGVTFDKKFLEYRKRLQAFDGIEMTPAPEGFEGTLRDYQKQGLGWLKFLREFQVGGCLADDMGLGKTIQVLAHLESIRAAGEAAGKRKPCLAVVPKSLVFNWKDEATKFTPALKVIAYTGVERHASFETLSDADLIVTTYGTLRLDIEKLKDVDFDTVILDEAQAIKNGASNSAKACRLLKSDHRLAMTGTPIENHLGELWSLFEFLNPGMLGRSSAFQSVSKLSGGDSSSLTILARAIAPYVLRRTKAQVLKELPEKTEQTLYVDLPPKHRKLYDELRDHFRASLTATIETKGLAQSKIHVLEALLRLRQAACHPGLIDAKRAKEGSAKLEALLEQLEDIIAEGHKVLVFSQFTSLLSLVDKALKAKKIPFEYLDGKTSNRKARVEHFQSDATCPVFLISLKAGGHGLNLTAADYVFILDPWWNPAVEAQAIDRAHRMGQTRSVFAYRIIARDTVEEKVLELQKQKRDLAEAIISENESLIRKMTADDLQLLLS